MKSWQSGALTHSWDKMWVSAETTKPVHWHQLMVQNQTAPETIQNLFLQLFFLVLGHFLVFPDDLTFPSITTTLNSSSSHLWHKNWNSSSLSTGCSHASKSSFPSHLCRFPISCSDCLAFLSSAQPASFLPITYWSWLCSPGQVVDVSFWPNAFPGLHFHWRFLTGANDQANHPPFAQTVQEEMLWGNNNAKVRESLNRMSPAVPQTTDWIKWLQNEPELVRIQSSCWSKKQRQHSV